MAVLLDTHALLWVITDDARLPGWLADAAANRPDSVAYSDASIWEIAIKSSIGKLDVRDDLPGVLSRTDHPRVAISSSAIWAVRQLPAIHRDPFDRLLVSQALEHDLILATADEVVAQYPVAVRWAS